MDSAPQSYLLTDIILNCRKPLVLRNFDLKWKCFDCSIEEWCHQFDAVSKNAKKVLFEQMPMKFGDSPQWERYRSSIEITFTDFLDVHSKDANKWTAFNYHQVDEIPLECRHDVDFSCFGFLDAAKESSFWLSSKGANTPCHFDTYGCNIVVQVYGRKRWLLFPPETQLTPIRIPYEESSIYCSENFFSPKNIKSLSTARMNAYECCLEEGDVLIVPRNWWHYVESLNTSLSVNTWIPLDTDIDAQIEECIVKYIIESCVNGESEQIKQHVLNPNQLDFLTTSRELFQILRVLLESKAVAGKTKQSSDTNKYSSSYLSETEVNDLIKKSKCDISVVKALDPTEFDDLMNAKTNRYVDMALPDNSKIDPIQESLLNAICHPNVVKTIKDKFLQMYCGSI